MGVPLATRGVGVQMSGPSTATGGPGADAEGEPGPGEPVDVLVIGGGVTGLYQLYRAREAGVSVLLLEAGAGVGGTWFWNRYPQARFDSESYSYGFLVSEELWREWRWSEQYAGQPEIERYFNHAVDRFDLRRHIVLNTTVTAVDFDEHTATHTVRTRSGPSY